MCVPFLEKLKYEDPYYILYQLYQLLALFCVYIPTITHDNDMIFYASNQGIFYVYYIGYSSYLYSRQISTHPINCINFVESPSYVYCLTFFSRYEKQIFVYKLDLTRYIALISKGTSAIRITHKHRCTNRFAIWTDIAHLYVSLPTALSNKASMGHVTEKSKSSTSGIAPTSMNGSGAIVKENSISLSILNKNSVMSRSRKGSLSYIVHHSKSVPSSPRQSPGPYCKPCLQFLHEDNKITLEGSNQSENANKTNLVIGNKNYMKKRDSANIISTFSLMSRRFDDSYREIDPFSTSTSLDVLENSMSMRENFSSYGARGVTSNTRIQPYSSNSNESVMSSIKEERNSEGNLNSGPDRTCKYCQNSLNSEEKTCIYYSFNSSV